VGTILSDKNIHQLAGEIKQAIYSTNGYTLQDIEGRLRDPRREGDRIMAFCPCHNDGATQGRRSLSVKDERGKVLLYCFAGCKYEDIMDTLGLKPDINAPKAKRVIVTTYDYRDADGRVRYQAVRYHPKSFVQCQLNEAGGKIWNMKGVEPLPFRLPELLTAIKKGDPVFIVEGEKDVLNLAVIGITATCNHGGAGKWKRELSKHFPDNTEVAILPDNDEPGRQHAEKIAQELHARGCRVRIVSLENLPDKGDVSDWLNNGGTKEALLRLVDGCQEREPSDEPEAEGETEDGKKPSQADKLIQIAVGGAFPFHDEARDGFASIPINGHKETWPLRSKFFKQYLVRQFYELTEKSPNNEALRQALNVVEAKAVFDGPEIKLHLRTAEHDGALWYDLANDAWQAITITAAGWEVVDNPPILFRRYKNTAAQVLPKPGGKLGLLKKYVNLKDEADWALLFALIVHAFVPGVPHGIPVFHGDKGSAKTTAQRVIRKLIDPAIRDTMALPQDKNELALMLTTNYSPIFDNLDGLKPWQSDMLCQAATGGGISKRELYSDMEEIILSFLRCPMLNGINLVASRDDLLDRSVLFKLDRISQEQRKTEKDFWRALEWDRPYILGAIFTALSGAMRIYPTVNLPALPRMADFAEWGYAIMQAVDGSGDEFLWAYHKNIAGAVEEAVISDVIGAAVAEFMDDKESWQGTATELLEQLNELPSVNTKEKGWPKKAYTLTRRLNKIKSALADYGINVETSRTGEKRFIAFANNRKIASLASLRHEATENGHSGDDAISSQASLLASLRHEASNSNDAIDDVNDAIENKASCREPLGNKGYDANDANDAILGTSGGGGTEEIEVFEI